MKERQIQALEGTLPTPRWALGMSRASRTITAGVARPRCSPPWTLQSGEVLTQCKRLHCYHAFLLFLEHIDANVPARFDVHLVLDNYATHTHAKVKAKLTSGCRGSGAAIRPTTIECDQGDGV